MITKSTKYYFVVLIFIVLFILVRDIYNKKIEEIDKHFLGSMMIYEGLNDIKFIEGNLYDTMEKNNITYKKTETKKELYKKTKLLLNKEKCFVYKLRMKDFLTEKQYKKYYYLRKYIGISNYNNLKNCKMEDYNICSIYITERGTLSPGMKYNCD